MSLANIFYIKVVDYESEHYWPPLIPQKFGSIWERVVVIVSDALGEKIYSSFPDWDKPYTPFQILK